MAKHNSRAGQIRAADIPEADRRSMRKMSVAELTEKNFKKTWGIDLNAVLKGDEVEKVRVKPKK